MNEQDEADRFSRDVDNLLGEARRADVERTPPEYQQLIDLARTLATADFSAESRVRQALRQQLPNRMDSREERQQRKEHPLRTPVWRLRPALILMTIVLSFLLVGLTAAAPGIADFIQSLWLGEYSWIFQVNPTQTASDPQSPPPETPFVEYRGDLWIIHTAIGNAGGDVPPGQDITVQRFNSLDEVQAAAPFDLRLPTYLPAGYTFREAMIAPYYWVFLFYEGPNGDIILRYIPVGEQPGSRTGSVGEQPGVTTGSVFVVAVGMLTDKPIEPVTLNGQEAGWIAGYGLMWESNGMSYSVGGANLSLEEAIRIAESLE